MDRAALEHALRSCVTFAPDDEDSLVFILDEACRDVTLASDRTVPASIDELDAHPLTAVLRQYLPDLLNIEPDPLFLFSVFDALHEPPDETPLEAETKHSRRPRACELCGRIMPLTIHHLIPRNEWALLVKRAVFTLDECKTRLAYLCRPCHSAVHRAADTPTLALRYNTIDALLDFEPVQRFAAYASKLRPSGFAGRHPR